MKSITLYKSLSPVELAGVINNGWQSFAPLPIEQTIFAPKINLEHAQMLARQLEACLHTVGYVVCFTIEADFLQRFQCQTIAYEEQREYRIPAEELALFNQHLIGRIQPLTAFVNPAKKVSSLEGCVGFH